MKKTISFFISIMAIMPSCVFASSLSLVGGGTEIDTTDISGTYEQINISTIGTAYSGNSSTGLITVQRSTATSAFNPTVELSYINANADYAFTGEVVLDCSDATTAGNHVISTNVYDGSTLTFLNGITVKNAVNNTRFRFGGVLQDVKGNVVVNALSGSIVNSTSKVSTSELILMSINFTVNNTNNTVVDLGKYTHIFYETELILNTDAKTSVLAGRSSKKGLANNLIGTVKMNGNELNAGWVYYNPDSATQGGSLTIDMNGDSSIFILGDNGISYNLSYDKSLFSLDFVNFTAEDKFYSTKLLSNTMLSFLTINGLKGEDILVDTEEYNGKTYYSYYVNIPEPATHATIFGAAVLALAVWRRRK